MFGLPAESEVAAPPMLPRDFSTFASRLMFLVRTYGGHDTLWLAKKLDVSQRSCQMYMQGRGRPGFEMLETILLLFPEVSARWLICGEQK